MNITRTKRATRDNALNRLRAHFEVEDNPEDRIFTKAELSAKLRGKAVSGPALRAFCAEIAEADPLDDLHASAEYRRHLLGVFSARTIERAIQRAQA